MATPDRGWIIWTNGVARLFTNSLDEVDVVLGPNPPREISGCAPALRVVPTPTGDRAWLVQPGITYESDDYPTLVDLVDVADGSTLLSIETDGTAFPVATTDTGLVLDVHEWFDTGDGFVTEPSSEFVIHMLDNGTTVPIGEGRAIAASPTRMVRIASDRLLVSAPDGSREAEVAKTFDGAWIGIVGPMIPSDAMPFQTVSPDGYEVLVSLGRELGQRTSSTVAPHPPSPRRHHQMAGPLNRPHRPGTIQDIPAQSRRREVSGSRRGAETTRRVDRS